MKLATLNDGSRDGQLAVVSRDLYTAHYATGIAGHLQQALDDWNFMAPQLQDLYDTLNHGKARHAFPLDPRQCMAPLPRAYLLAVADPSAGLASEGRAIPLSAKLRLSFADELLGACRPMYCACAAQQADFEAGLSVISGDLPHGANPEQALEGVRLLMLSCQQQLRALQARPEQRLMSRPQTAFSPVAVTPDELVFGGEGTWAGGRLALTLNCTLNGRKLGLCDASQGMPLHFGQLMAALCQTRRLRAGAIICSGEIRNQDSSRGSFSLASRRAIEVSQGGFAKTPWLGQDDIVHIEIKGRDGQTVFGAIESELRLGDTGDPLRGQPQEKG